MEGNADTNVTPAEERARELANAFASARVDGFCDKIVSLSDKFTADEIKQIKKQVGIAVSVAYFHGYMARNNGEKLRKLYL